MGFPCQCWACAQGSSSLTEGAQGWGFELHLYVWPFYPGGGKFYQDTQLLLSAWGSALPGKGSQLGWRAPKVQRSCPGTILGAH